MHRIFRIVSSCALVASLFVGPAAAGEEVDDDALFDWLQKVWDQRYNGAAFPMAAKIDREERGGATYFALNSGCCAISTDPAAGHVLVTANTSSLPAPQVGGFLVGLDAGDGFLPAERSFGARGRFAGQTFTGNGSPLHVTITGVGAANGLPGTPGVVTIGARLQKLHVFTLDVYQLNIGINAQNRVGIGAGVALSCADSTAIAAGASFNLELVVDRQARSVLARLVVQRGTEDACACPDGCPSAPVALRLVPSATSPNPEEAWAHEVVGDTGFAFVSQSAVILNWIPFGPFGAQLPAGPGQRLEVAFDRLEIFAAP